MVGIYKGKIQYMKMLNLYLYIYKSCLRNGEEIIFVRLAISCEMLHYGGTLVSMVMMNEYLCLC